MDTLRILDTDVFIDHFRGLAGATAYIQSLLIAQRATTDVTVIVNYIRSCGWPEENATAREKCRLVSRKALKH